MTNPIQRTWGGADLRDAESVRFMHRRAEESLGQDLRAAATCLRDFADRIDQLAQRPDSRPADRVREAERYAIAALENAHTHLHSASRAAEELAVFECSLFHLNPATNNVNPATN